jgi:hypothetical protein
MNIKIIIILAIDLCLIKSATFLIPPKFQWKTLDFAWNNDYKHKDLLAAGDYIAENNMPTGLLRWKDKLFITIPRWKEGY